MEEAIRFVLRSGLLGRERKGARVQRRKEDLLKGSGSRAEI